MYEEEKKNSFIKDLIIKLLYFFLFLFLFMWLYPAPKVNLDEVEVKVDKEALEPVYKQVFANNISNMKDAGRTYFTTNRLPSKAGDKVRITLKEMLDKKLLLEFTDEDGNTCDGNESYIEVSKTNDSEYNMKVYLSCNNKKDYVNEIIGCNSTCPTGTCNNVVTGTTNNTNTSTNKSATGGTTYKYVAPSGGNNTTTYVPVPGKNTTTTVYVPTNPTTETIINTPQTTENTRYVTVTFDSQGGTNVDKQTMVAGNTAYEPVTTRSGYVFNCWSTSQYDSSCRYSYNFNTPVYSDKTLYAQWTTRNTRYYDDNNYNNVQYEYTKTYWEPDYTWTTTYKTGSNVRIINTTNSYDNNSTTRSYTYRTISWFRGSDSTWTYGLWLNNIPSDARNVRFTAAPTRFSDSYNIEAYKSNRYSCVIQMVGYGCPTPYDDAIIPNEDESNHSVGSFGFSYYGPEKVGGKYKVTFNLYNSNMNGSSYQYLAPIKFTVSWNEGSSNNVTKYQYSYRRTSTRYSTSRNDRSLINDGYVLTGNTR